MCIRDSPEIIAPVCVDDQSFENACFAEAAGYNSFSVGACGTRSCTQTYAPVCAANKQTYMNACIAERSGVNIKFAGLCPEQGKYCPETWAPVCGVDKTTYDNRCFLDNAKVKIAYAGVCFGQ